MNNQIQIFVYSQDRISPSNKKKYSNTHNNLGESPNDVPSKGKKLYIK